METTSNKFSFKYAEKKKFFKEIQNFNSRKASQKNDISVNVPRILSLSDLLIAIFMTESKELKLTLHLVIGAM